MRVEFDPNKIDVLLYQLAGYSFIRKFLKPTDVVLDVGCGEGYTAKFLSEKCAHINGVDSDKNIIIQNGEKYGSTKCIFIWDDIFKYEGCPYKPKTGNHYDIIVCRDLIEHFTAKRGESLIMKIHPLLRDDSSILFLGTVREGVVANRPYKQGHIHEYSHNELKELLESYFKRVIFFSQTDEIVSLQEPKEMCWRWIVMCWGKKE